MLLGARATWSNFCKLFPEADLSFFPCPKACPWLVEFVPRVVFVPVKAYPGLAAAAFLFVGLGGSLFPFLFVPPVVLLAYLSLLLEWSWLMFCVYIFFRGGMYVVELSLVDEKNFLLLPPFALA